MRSAPRLVKCLDQLSKALRGNVPIAISATSSFFFLFLFLPLLLFLFFLLSWENYHKACVKAEADHKQIF